LTGTQGGRGLDRSGPHFPVVRRRDICPAVWTPWGDPLHGDCTVHTGRTIIAALVLHGHGVREAELAQKPVVCVETALRRRGLWGDEGKTPREQLILDGLKHPLHAHDVAAADTHLSHERRHLLLLRLRGHVVGCVDRGDAAEGLAVEFLKSADLHGQEPHAVPQELRVVCGRRHEGLLNLPGAAPAPESRLWLGSGDEEVAVVVVDGLLVRPWCGGGKAVPVPGVTVPWRAGEPRTALSGVKVAGVPRADSGVVVGAAKPPGRECLRGGTSWGAEIPDGGYTPAGQLQLDLRIPDAFALTGRSRALGTGAVGGILSVHPSRNVDAAGR